MDTCCEDLYACPGTIPAHIHLSSYDKDKEGNEKKWVLLLECVVDTAGLVHPRSQDSLLPTRHLLINTETDSRVKWLVESFSQCVWRAVSAARKRPVIYSVHAEKWCLHVCIVCRELHTNHNHSRNHKCNTAL